MPGTLIIDQSRTFSAPPIVMAVAPRLKFGTEVQEVNTTTGEAKWTVQAAVSYIPQNGMRAVAEVIDVTITGGDPMSLAPGTSVEFADLRCGVSAPEQRQRQDGGGSRVVGGKLWFQASAVRPVGARQPKADAA
jgi:hypothetical protein